MECEVVDDVVGVMLVLAECEDTEVLVWVVVVPVIEVVVLVLLVVVVVDVLTV